MLVIDMDVPEGYYNIKTLQAQYDTLPPTRMSSTANGGLHYFYQYPQDGNTYPGTVGLADLIGHPYEGANKKKLKQEAVMLNALLVAPHQLL